MRRLVYSSLVMLIVLAMFASAQTSFSGTRSGASYVQYGPSDFRTYYGPQYARDYWPILYSGNESVCEGRQDLLIQVSPLGCQPSVVRSDLLAEQNVPVFCQLDAFRVNPLVDVKQIRNIHFSFVKNKPKEVIDVGFHPARASLQTRNELVGNPLLTNIGYLVVVLKRDANESALSNFFNFTVGARLEYKAGNAFGIGKATFLLEPVSDEQWKIERNRQSFFKGQYSVRLDEADSESAQVSVYRGDRRIASTTVKRGGTSQDMYIEGAYCQARIQIAYDQLEAPEKTARLQVDDDVLELMEGSSFLDDKCRVSKIALSGDDEGNVELNCGGRNVGLRLSPKQLVRGDEVYLVENKRVDYSKVWAIVLVNKPKDKNSVTTYDLVNTQDVNDKKTNVLGVRAASADKLIESDYSKEIDDYFETTIDTYEDVARNYPFANNESSRQPFGEQALERAIALADEMGKQQTAAELISLYLEVYGNSSKADYYLGLLEGQYGFDRALAFTTVEVDNGVHSIHLIEVKKPEKQAHATFTWGGSQFSAPLHGSYSIDGRVNFTLDSLDVDKATVTAYCYKEQGGKGIYEREKSSTLELGRGVQAGRDIHRTESLCGGVLKLDEINLEQKAKIRILPSIKGTQVETNVTVGVGIEKRAIKLTPDKTRERIEELNKTIAKWDSISNNLGNVVKGMKAACFATAGVLTVKNFVTGLNGEALARQNVMRAPGGWTEWCQRAVANGEYGGSIGRCYSENSNKINQDVRVMTGLINEDNAKIKTIESASGIKTSSDLFGSSIDGEKAKNRFISENLGSYGEQKINISGEPELVEVSVLTREINGRNDLTYDEAKKLKLYLDMRARAGDSPVAQQLADRNLESIGRRVIDQQKFVEVRSSLAQDLANTGLGGSSIESFGERNALQGKFDGKYLKSGDFGLSSEMPAKVITYSGVPYLVTLTDVGGGRFTPTDVYKLDKNSQGQYLSTTPASSEDVAKIKDRVPVYKKVSSSDCRNKFKNPEIKFYETEPYKGMPAIVPFDIEDGWYAATQQTLPGFGNIKVFQSSGRPVSFWVCNVGADGEADFFVSGLDDDICQRFDVETGAPLDTFSCLDEGQTKQIVARAQRALMDAARQREQGKTGRINIDNAGAIKVGPPAVNLPGTQCQDFMSPDDCKLLFNVCDPVICPASRCNFGGQYPVSDVIQSGIVGSALLCLPNWNEGVYVPVCLTGIKAGIDGYLSILKSHQQCLQESLETGRYVGTCDLVTSVYLCEFFWRQAAPVANVLLPKLVEFAYGQSQARGGGEYLTVQSAWDNAQASANYFTQSYAVNSLEAFKLRSIDEAGSEFCRSFISAKAPTQFKSLIEPDSPPQFHAWFSTIPFSDATVPATAQYKVFYHIFAGKDRGVSFSVYLKEPPQTSYYQTQPTVLVATGFVSLGQFATETRDFTAPTGYQQLCVRINDKEECGFKQVSTSFALNQVRDNFISGEINRTGITSEKTCVSGQLNPAALLNPNPQEAVQEAIDPAIYNRGVTRICATENPGRSTDPVRFVDVGYCDNQRIRCWLDAQSVDKAITAVNVGVRNATLTELQQRANEQLREAGNYIVDNDLLKQELQSAVGDETPIDKQKGESIIDKLNAVLANAVYSSQKAQVIFLKGTIYDAITRDLYTKISQGATTSGTASNSAPAGAGPQDNGVPAVQTNTQSGSQQAANPPVITLTKGLESNFVIDGVELNKVYIDSTREDQIYVRVFGTDPIVGFVKKVDVYGNAYNQIVLDRKKFLAAYDNEDFFNLINGAYVSGVNICREPPQQGSTGEAACAPQSR